MGIKGLPNFIRQKAGTYAMNSYEFSRFEGFRVAVDASLLIHQTVIALRSTGKDMKNSKGQLTSHLHGILYKILIFLQNKMVPIFVFDGKAPNIKNRTLEKRKTRKKIAENKLKELSDEEDEEYIKNFKQTFKPNKEDIKEATILLDLMGIPYIIAPGEADVVCAWLASRHDENKKRYVKGVCSDDSDILAFGAHYLFKDMLKFMSKNKKVTIISLHKTLAKLNLTMKQFTDLCVLLGCDYCDNIRGIGPETAFKLLKEHKSLEKVLEYLDEKNKKESDSDSDNSDEKDSSDDDGLTQSNEECMVEARNYFCNAVKELDESDDFVITDDNLKLRQFQFEELMDFLCVKHNFDVLRTKTALDRLDYYYKNMNITRENTKKIHKILQPRSENYIFKALSDNIDFISSDSDSDSGGKKIPSK